MRDTQAVRLINLVRELSEIENKLKSDTLSELGKRELQSKSLGLGGSISSLATEIEYSTQLACLVKNMPVGLMLMHREENIWNYYSIPDRMVFVIPATGKGEPPVFKEGPDPHYVMEQ